jgi:methionyl-tRNA synthetase
MESETYTEKLTLVYNLLDKFEIKNALVVLNDILKNANKYITDKEPWKKDKTDTKIVLNNLYWILSEVTDLYSIFIPEKTDEIKKVLSDKKKVILFNRINI